jgi:hypothetical protein
MSDYHKFLEEVGITEEDCERAIKSVQHAPMTINESCVVQIGASSIHGRGIFSARQILDGEGIAPVFCHAPDVWSFTGRYMNHSPEPNCVVVIGYAGAAFEASRTIEAGEELTSDYRQIRGVICR